MKMLRLLRRHGLLPAEARRIRVLFVCLGNICRSPMAEAVARKLALKRGVPDAFRFASAGIAPPVEGAPADLRAIRAAERRGYDLSGHRARRVDSGAFDSHDLVLAMDCANLLALQKIAPASGAPRVELFLGPAGHRGVVEVPDPYYGNAEGFERVLDLCESRLPGLLEAALDSRGRLPD